MVKHGRSFAANWDSAVQYDSPEVGGGMFVGNIGELVPNCTASHFDCFVRERESYLTDLFTRLCFKGLTWFETSRMLSLNVICQFWVFGTCIIWYMSAEVTDVSSPVTFMIQSAHALARVRGGWGTRIASIGYIRPPSCLPCLEAKLETAAVGQGPVYSGTRIWTFAGNALARKRSIVLRNKY